MKERIIFFAVIIVACARIAVAQNVNLLVGSAANDEKTDGIYLYEFNTATGEASFRKKTPVDRPSYLAFSKDRAHLYSITGGADISSYKYHAGSGELTFQNKQGSGGAGPIHISTDDRARYIFAANYDGGSLTVLPLEKNGSLSPVSQTLLQQGRSIDTLRQTKPYVHSVVLSPDNRYLFSADLGTDRLNIYKLSKKQSPTPLEVSEQGFISMKPGSGPRFFTFHPNEKNAYLIQEMGGLFTAFNYTGKGITAIQDISMLSEDFKGKSGAADLHISPDGKFLYGSNRGDANELVIFSIDQHTGRLSFAGRYKSPLKRPRYFAIDPAGNFLLLTNQGSDNIAILKRDKTSGLLSPAGQISVRRPVCLLFSE